MSERGESVSVRATSLKNNVVLWFGAIGLALLTIWPLASLPWGRLLPVWVLAILAGLGLLAGAVGAALTRPDRSLVGVSAVGMMATIVGAGVVWALPPIAPTTPQTFAVESVSLFLYGSTVALVLALELWLTLAVAASAGVGLAALVVLFCWHGRTLALDQRLTLVAAAPLVVIVLRAAVRRADAQRWARLRLRVETGLWWTWLRSTLLLALLATVVALAPIVVLPQASLGAWLQQTLSRPPHLVVQNGSATPQFTAGHPLALTSAAATGHTAMLSYRVLHTPNGMSAVPLQLVAATYDSYLDGEWFSSPAHLAPSPNLPTPDASRLVQAEITLLRPEAFLPADGPGTLLPGIDQPVSFAGPGGASAALSHMLPSAPLPTGAPADASAADATVGTLLLSVADWQTPHPVAAGYTYTMTALLPPNPAVPSAIGPLSTTLPADPADYGWAPTTLARLTAVPPALASRLYQTALQFVPRAASSHLDSSDRGASGASVAINPVAAATALATALRQRMTLDPAYAEPPGDAAVSDFLTHGHGNGLTWTTTYILLLRSLGVPVRLAEGFTAGSLDFTSGQQIVRVDDATVWAQIALPGVGWYAVSPTAQVVPVSSSTAHAGGAAGQGGRRHSTPAATATPTSIAHASPTPQALSRTQAPAPFSLGLPAWVRALFPLVVVALVLAILMFVGILLALLSRFGLGASHSDRGARVVTLAVLSAMLRRIAWLAQLGDGTLILSPGDIPERRAHTIGRRLPPAAAESLMRLSGAWNRLRFGVSDTAAATSAADPALTPTQAATDAAQVRAPLLRRLAAPGQRLHTLRRILALPLSLPPPRPRLSPFEPPHRKRGTHHHHRRARLSRHP